MNKTAIKNFSIWARNKLIADVSYRAGLMGITANGIDKPLPQSTAATEFYHIGTKEPYQISGEAISQRRRLVEVMERKARETDYATAYHYVLEEVAYTWFNRLIAMEVNDYLPSHIRVLSSETGKMEPDLVTTPFDADLDFTGDEKDAILRMQRDNDVDGLFHLLFIKQCNALGAILPGLFEKTNDFTELLLGLSVIDREGVVYRLVHDIDEDDFNIEQDDGVEIIGWLYQYWNTEPKAAVFGRASGTKIKKEEIPAATQLFTPHWIVRYMVENSLGRLWVEGHPNDDLKSKWTYYLDEAEQEPDVQAKLAEIHKEYAALNPEDIRCIDPCCGSGHILAYLFDVLVQIYESRGYAARDAAQSIVRFNLHGLDIDKRAAQLAYFSVMMKARQYDRRFFSRNLQPMVYSTTGDEDGENFGSLVKVDDAGARPEEPQTIFEQVDYEKRLNAWSYRYLLAQKYHVVVTNPPYMGSSGMNSKLNEFVRSSYSSTKYDLSTAFMEKTLEMCDSHGFMAMINIPVWMFLSSFERMRNHLISCHTFSTMLHFGRGVFGSDFGTTAFVIQKKVVANYTAKYFKLYDRQGEVEPISVKEEKFLGGHGLHQMQQNKFLNLPGSQIAYWIPSKVYDAFALDKEEKLKIFTKSGLTTGDNEKFLKHWSEIQFNHIYHTWQDDSVIPVWYAHLKGGDFRKWYGNYDYVIHYDVVALADMKKCPGFRHDGKEYFFKESVTWSKTTAGPLSARINFNDSTFNTAGCCLFSEGRDYYVLAVLNSKVAQLILSFLCPSLSYAPGDVEKLPILYSDKEVLIQELAKHCVATSKKDWDSFETSWDFIHHPMVCGVSTVAEAYAAWERECAERFNQLKANEEELNRIFINIYGLRDELTPEVEDKDVTVRKADLGRDVRSLLSYAVGCMFGRYSLEVEGLAYAGGTWDASKYSAFLPDADGILPITDEEYLEDDIVSLLCKWLKAVYGPDTLEENLDFIAGALGNKGATSREVIRSYFLKDFFTDHCKIYQKRPIYWLFDSGKQNGFKALIYLHRYTPDTVGNVRVDYLHRLQRIYESEIDRMQDMIDHSKSPREAANAAKRKEKLQKQLKECRDYDGKIGHLALSRIALDLDDGVKVNYRKMQTASDGKLYEVLADSGNIMGKK